MGLRVVAQSGRALRSGRRGRWFESSRPDQHAKMHGLFRQIKSHQRFSALCALIDSHDTQRLFFDQTHEKKCIPTPFGRSGKYHEFNRISFEEMQVRVCESWWMDRGILILQIHRNGECLMNRKNRGSPYTWVRNQKPVEVTLRMITKEIMLLIIFN